MAYMTDQGRSTLFLNYVFNGGGSAGTITQPYMLYLMSAMGAGNGNTSGSNGTQLTSGNSPGYTAGGKSLGASAPFGTFTAAASSGNANSVTWTATGTWTAGVLGIEIWDSAGTPLRWLQGLLTTAIGTSVVLSGDTVSFAVDSIVPTAVAW
jgi:hypothetical protein